MSYEDLFIKYQQAALHVVSSSSSSMGDPKGSFAMEHLKNLSKFIYALDPTLRGKVLSKNPSNFKEALCIAMKKEASLQIESAFQPSMNVLTPPPRVEESQHPRYRLPH